ncbi:MAG TPA: hypothetical protein VKA60_17965 [Blastocatellia bacterium]|nr:hypothetical protein [Blastocatellia bacterium]
MTTSNEDSMQGRIRCGGEEAVEGGVKTKKRGIPPQKMPRF